MTKILFLAFTLLNCAILNAQHCGVSKIGVGNIFGGNKVVRGQFPW
jgi:hypothetical protein